MGSPTRFKSKALSDFGEKQASNFTKNFMTLKK